LQKEKVSGVGESIFYSVIKKYAPRFSYHIQQVAFEGRVVVRFPGCWHYRFVTTVDEEWRSEALSRLENRLKRREKFPPNRHARRNMRRADRSKPALLE